jgi:outer membrane lipoprotein-sorting protein
MNKITTILLLAISSTLYAQDPLAKEALDKLRSTTKSYKNMTIGFDFIIENKSQNIKETQQGILVLQEDKFILEMDAQTIINNGESQWVYLSDMNEVQIMEHDPEEEMTPNKLFTIYENGYKYTYIGASSVQGKRLQLIDLFPEESGDFMKINIAIDAVKNEIYRIRMHDKNGGTYTYLVNSFKSNTKTKPFYFDNEKHQGVEVIDLR